MRVALTTGAHLVPVLSFGENDLFDPVAVEKHSLMWHVQQLTKAWLGFCVPLFKGQGLLGCSRGLALLPKPRPIVTVVGKPVPVPKWQGDSSPHTLTGSAALILSISMGFGEMYSNCIMSVTAGYAACGALLCACCNQGRLPGLAPPVKSEFRF